VTCDAAAEKNPGHRVAGVEQLVEGRVELVGGDREVARAAAVVGGDERGSAQQLLEERRGEQEDDIGVLG